MKLINQLGRNWKILQTIIVLIYNKYIVPAKSMNGSYKPNNN